MGRPKGSKNKPKVKPRIKPVAKLGKCHNDGRYKISFDDALHKPYEGLI